MNVGQIDGSGDGTGGGGQVTDKRFHELFIWEGCESLLEQRFKAASCNCFGGEVHFIPSCSRYGWPQFHCDSNQDIDIYIYIDGFQYQIHGKFLTLRGI